MTLASASPGVAGESGPDPSAHPTSCPSWCKDRGHPAAHHFGPSSTAHWSPQYVLPGEGSTVMLRAELVRLDEGDRVGEQVLYVSGETDKELSSLAEADIYIAQAQAFVDMLRVLRRQMT